VDGSGSSQQKGNKSEPFFTTVCQPPATVRFLLALGTLASLSHEPGESPRFIANYDERIDKNQGEKGKKGVTLQFPKVKRTQDSGSRIQDTEPGTGKRDSGVREQEPGLRCQGTGIRIQEQGINRKKGRNGDQENRGIGEKVMRTVGGRGKSEER
jgi:hypothetical protein